MVFAFTLIALILRLLNLGRGFSGDETILVGISQRNSAEVVSSVVGNDVYPPFTYLFAHYLGKLGSPEIWIRLYFVLFGVGCCLLVYAIARKLFDKKAAALALLFAACSPLLIFASQYARSYIDSSFWMLLSCFFMLKILKGEPPAASWIGYIISVVLSLYTFYLSVILFVAQFIFAIAVQPKNLRRVSKWIFAYIIIALAYAPWLASAFRQFHNASSLAYNWSDKGFNLGIFRIGLYIRNISALFGADPYFMSYQGSISGHFPKGVLAIGIILFTAVFAFFLYRCFKFLISRYPDNMELAWFLPALSLGPIALSWIESLTLGILPNARYLAAFHALFLILIAAVVAGAIERKRLFGYIMSAGILLAFAARIAYATGPEFDSKPAAYFLKNNIKPGEPVICARSTPDQPGLNIIDVSGYFKLNDNRSAYIISPPNGLEEISAKILPFGKVWVYKTYGNAEIFGSNRLLEDWLKKQGYSGRVKSKFKNIDIVLYEK